MRGIVETVAEGNFRDRVMRLRRVRQLGRGPLQPALAQIMRKAASRPFEQLLQIALGYSFELRHPRRRQTGLIQLALDGLAKPATERRLRHGPGSIRRRRYPFAPEGRQQIRETLSDRGPLRIRSA